MHNTLKERKSILKTPFMLPNCFDSFPISSQKSWMLFFQLSCILVSEQGQFGRNILILVIIIILCCGPYLGMLLHTTGCPNQFGILQGLSKASSSDFWNWENIAQSMHFRKNLKVRTRYNILNFPALVGLPFCPPGRYCSKKVRENRENSKCCIEF